MESSMPKHIKSNARRNSNVFVPGVGFLTEKECKILWLKIASKKETQVNEAYEEMKKELVCHEEFSSNSSAYDASTTSDSESEIASTPKVVKNKEEASIYTFESLPSVNLIQDDAYFNRHSNTPSNDITFVLLFLSDDIVKEIMTYLSPRGIATVALLSKRLNVINMKMLRDPAYRLINCWKLYIGLDLPWVCKTEDEEPNNWTRAALIELNYRSLFGQKLVVPKKKVVIDKQTKWLPQPLREFFRNTFGPEYVHHLVVMVDKEKRTTPCIDWVVWHPGKFGKVPTPIEVATINKPVFLEDNKENLLNEPKETDAPKRPRSTSPSLPKKKPSLLPVGLQKSKATGVGAARPKDNNKK